MGSIFLCEKVSTGRRDKNPRVGSVRWVDKAGMGQQVWISFVPSLSSSSSILSLVVSTGECPPRPACPLSAHCPWARSSCRWTLRSASSSSPASLAALPSPPAWGCRGNRSPPCAAPPSGVAVEIKRTKSKNLIIIYIWCVFPFFFSFFWLSANIERLKHFLKVKINMKLFSFMWSTSCWKRVESRESHYSELYTKVTSVKESTAVRSDGGRLWCWVLFTCVGQGPGNIYIINIYIWI